MPFTSYDDLISEITAGKIREHSFVKVSTAPEAAGVWHSLWLAPGNPGAGAAPAATPGTAYDDALGSIFFPDQATDTKHLITFGAVANANCSLMLYDRLVAVSGISVASTGSKTVNSAALPRYSGAAAYDVGAFAEVTTATTVAAPIINLLTYTNQDGATGRVGTNATFPAVATNVDTLIGLPLQAGDLGVRSVETLNVGTAGSAGVINIVLIKPLVVLPMVANQWNERDLVLQLTSLPRAYDGASLALAILATGTTAVTVWGQLRLAWG